MTDQSQQRMVMIKRLNPTFEQWLASREGEQWTSADSARVRNYIRQGDQLAQEVFNDIRVRVTDLLR
jgi:hypothetical protein